MNKHLLIVLLLTIASWCPAQTEKVIFSVPGGFYENNFQLSLGCLYADHTVRYTINGNAPTASSTVYETPLTLDEHLLSPSNIHTIAIAPKEQMFYPDHVERCIVIRAAVYDSNDSCISDIATNTYCIKSLGNDHHGLPLISICADSLDLFDYEHGIFVPGVHYDPADPQWTGNYYQTGREWERAVNVEFYETDNTGINQMAGLRTHGGNGRRKQQKSLKIYAREEYGKKKFKHPFFQDITISSFKHLTLKPFSSSWTQAGMENHLCNAIARQLPNVESLASRPAVLFLNGEYWGIYYLQEKADERYLENHFDVDLDDVDIVGNWYNHCEYGDAHDFFETIDQLERADLCNPAEYNRIEQFIDLNSFIDYQILELFLANTDWPSNNMRCWREDNGKWRWIFYDGDACLKDRDFDVFTNATYTGSDTWPSCKRATLLFRRLLANPTFRDMFYLRFKELLNTQFQYSNTSQYLNDLQSQLDPEILSQSNRFNIPENKQTWLQHSQRIDDFLRQRTVEMETELDRFYESEPWVFSEWICYATISSNLITMSFHTSQSSTMPLTIHDLSGRCLYSEIKNIHSGFNTISINFHPKAGMYMLTMGQKSQIIIIF